MTSSDWDALDNIMGDAKKVTAPPSFLDTGILELNSVISGRFDGGLPVGRMVEVFGPASCGKTFLATMAMISAQRAGGIAGFCDHEEAFAHTLAASLGLKADKTFLFMQPETFEESVDKMMHILETIRGKGLIDEAAPIVWVFDSVASMIPHSKLFDDKGNRRQVGDLNMRDKLALAAATSQTYPMLAQWASKYNCLVLLLNQIRTKPGVMYGDPTTTPGGQAAEFYASVRLNLGKKEITNGKNGAEREVLGFEVTANCIKNKVARPHLKAKWQVRFEGQTGVLVDQVATNLDFLIRKGVIEKEGTRVVWEGKKLFQSALERELKEDPDGNEKLKAMLLASDVPVE